MKLFFFLFNFLLFLNVSAANSLTHLDTIPPTKLTEIKLDPSEEIKKLPEEMPRFPGCEDVLDPKERKNCAAKKMLAFIYANLKYPAQAKENGVQGTTVIQFIVTKDGFIAEPKIVKEIGVGCGEESRRVVALMNTLDERWIPGKEKGQIVNSIFVLPVKFRLPD